MIAVQGPNARAKLWQVLPGSEAATAALKPFSAVAFGDMFIARTGYTGEDGFEVVLPAGWAAPIWEKLAAAGVRPCGLGARDTLRLEAGMNLYGQDMDESVTPLESGLGWTVDLASARDFVGKARARREAAGARTARPAARWTRAACCAPTSACAPRTATARSPAAPSARRSPRRSRSRGCRPRCSAGDAVRVVVRDRELAARVVKPPFARNGKALVA